MEPIIIDIQPSFVKSNALQEATIASVGLPKADEHLTPKPNEFFPQHCTK